MTNTTAAQDRAIDNASGRVTEIIDELLAVIDDLDNQVTEAKSENERLSSELAETQSKLEEAHNQSSE